MVKEMKISPEFVAGFKELLRTGLFAASTGILVWLTTGEVDQKALWVAIGTAMLSCLSEYLHKLGKSEEEITGKTSALTRGLSRF